MVQPRRVDPSGYSPVLLPHQRLRGPPGLGTGPVLEAWRMVSALGPAGVVPGFVVHGVVPHQPSASASAATGPLLWPGLRQICPGASDRHGVCAWTGSPFHKQKKEGLDTSASDLSWEISFLGDLLKNTLNSSLFSYVSKCSSIVDTQNGQGCAFECHLKLRCGRCSFKTVFMFSGFCVHDVCIDLKTHWLQFDSATPSWARAVVLMFTAHSSYSTWDSELSLSCCLFFPVFLNFLFIPIVADALPPLWCRQKCYFSLQPSVWECEPSMFLLLSFMGTLWEILFQHLFFCSFR